MTKTLALSALALTLAAMPAAARQLTVEEALAAANATQTSSPKMRKAMNMAKPALTLKHTQKKNNLNTLYILSSENNGGFLVLSADDVAMPVLGYADEGSFDPDNIPPAMEGWLRHYSECIAYAAENGLTISGAPRNAAYEDIPAICQTRWNQDGPYWDLCPDDDEGKRCFTGCVATAMAQVMKVHRCPEEHGTGVASFDWGAHRLTLDMSKETFDWDNMLDVYNNGQDNETAPRCGRTHARLRLRRIHGLWIRR